MELIEIFKMTETQLLSKLPEYLKDKGYIEENITANDDFIYAKGKLPVLMTAHLDTVFTNLPSDETIIEEDGIISSPETGLGADDRAGVYGILQLLEYKPYVLFTTDEGVGRVGAKRAAESIVCPDIDKWEYYDR